MFSTLPILSRNVSIVIRIIVILTHFDVPISGSSLSYFRAELENSSKPDNLPSNPAKTSHQPDKLFFFLNHIKTRLQSEQLLL